MGASHGLSDEEIDAILVESCARSGVPLVVTDPVVLRRLAKILPLLPAEKNARVRQVSGTAA